MDSQGPTPENSFSKKKIIIIKNLEVQGDHITSGGPGADVTSEGSIIVVSYAKTRVSTAPDPPRVIPSSSHMGYRSTECCGSRTPTPILNLL